MNESHFVVSTVLGVMMTACGKAIAPHHFKAATVGQTQDAKVCGDCHIKINEGWVSFIF